MTDAQLDDVKDIDAKLAKEDLAVEEITKATELFKLHIPRNDHYTRSVVENTRELPAQFFTGGQKFPTIKYEDGDVRNLKGLTLYMTISEMSTAPAIKIKASYMDSTISSSTLASASFIIPFTGTRALKEFKFSHHGELYGYVFEMSFNCNGAFKGSGVVALAAFSADFSAEDREVWKFLLKMTTSTYTSTPMTLKFYQPHTKAIRKKKPEDGLRRRQWSELTKDEQDKIMADNAAANQSYVPGIAQLDNTLRRTFEHLPNGPDTTHVPESFMRDPFYAFASASGGIKVQADEMPTPYQLMEKKFSGLPALMYPFLPVNVFRSIDEYRVKMGQAVEGEHRETKYQLEQLCSPMQKEVQTTTRVKTEMVPNPHQMRLFHMGDIPFATIKLSPFKVLNEDAKVPIRIPGGTKVKLTWHSRKSEHLQEANGVVVSFNFTLKDYDLAVLLTDRNTASLGSNATETAPPGGKDKSTGMSKQFVPGKDNYMPHPYDVTMTIKPNDTLYKQNMATINIMGSDAAKQWHPFLLNQQPIAELEENFNPSECPQAKRANVASWNAKVDAVYERIMNWKPDGQPDFKWNAEQLKVLSKVKGDTTKLLLISGPAATGKTTVQQVMAYYFLSIGLDVVFDAPANTNVVDFMERMTANFPSVEPVCAAPRSLDSSLNDQSRNDQVEALTPGDFADDVTFDHLASMRHDAANKHFASKRFNLQTRVFAEAKNHTATRLTHSFKYGEPEIETDVYHNLSSWGDLYEDRAQVTDEQKTGFESEEKDEEHDDSREPTEDSFSIPPYDECLLLSDRIMDPALPMLPEGWSCKVHKSTNEKVAIETLVYLHTDGRHSTMHPSTIVNKDETKDAYDELEAFIKRAAATPINDWIDKKTGLKDDEAIKNFHYVYKLCCKIKLAHTRFLCGTSASVCSKLVRTNCFSGKYGARPSLGVVILKEESAKDTEPNFWGSIVYNCWAKLVVWVVAFGDTKQLVPVVTGSSGMYTTSYANAQLKKSYFTRAIEEGMRHFELVEQSRMHSAIVRIPNKFVYGGKLRTAPCCNKPLAKSLPNCNRVVEKLRDMFTASGNEYALEINERTLRNHHFIVPGSVSMNQTTSSRVNMEQVMFTVNTIVPAMRKIFETDTHDACKIIVGYAEAVDRITEELIKIRTADNSITRNMQPKVQTIDSSQGTEANWICFIHTCTDAEKKSQLFFMADNNRVNVALTRAKDIQTSVGGPMMGKAFDDTDVSKVADKQHSPLLLLAIRQHGADKTSFLVTTQKRIPNDELPMHLRE
ncbi:uncharacterized protein RCC_11287 [Ramularia collo-cygni]|uniref:DNA2/NAM7 helicase-like C-terminal domain-containing protein n=1 Tax=Ramularia collo-cygni TaxID=112498 RepID=A0A2D3VQJ2_9PEZI|nr:uncharacterized protein RCC_11287 [Ramularia collo-cygni]CZT25619.1 uncharacterized protein RCC_11287 [Ramularia collo-cygni]